MAKPPGKLGLFDLNLVCRVFWPLPNTRHAVRDLLRLITVPNFVVAWEKETQHSQPSLGGDSLLSVEFTFHPDRPDYPENG